MTELDIFAAIRPIIIKVTGVSECILADQNAPAPTGDYAAVRCKQSISYAGSGIKTRLASSAGFVADKVRRQIIATCSINFYRSNALDKAELMSNCNYRSDVSAELFKAGLGWMGSDAVNNLTALQSNRMEQRAQVSIRLGYETADEYEINAIEGVSVSVEYGAEPKGFNLNQVGEYELGGGFELSQDEALKREFLINSDTINQG